MLTVGVRELGFTTSLSRIGKSWQTSVARSRSGSESESGSGSDARSWKGTRAGTGPSKKGRRPARQLGGNTNRGHANGTGKTDPTNRPGSGPLPRS